MPADHDHNIYARSAPSSWYAWKYSPTYRELFYIFHGSEVKVQNYLYSPAFEAFDGNV